MVIALSQGCRELKVAGSGLLGLREEEVSQKRVLQAVQQWRTRTGYVGRIWKGISIVVEIVCLQAKSVSNRKVGAGVDRNCGSRSSQTDSGNHSQPKGLEFSWGCPFGFMMPTATDIGADFLIW